MTDLVVSPSAKWRPWKIGLCLVAIFLMGALAGSVLTLRAIHRAIERRADPARWTSTIMDRLDHDLRLTKEQRAKLEPIIRDGVDKGRDVRRKAAGDLAEIVRQTRDSAQSILTPDQEQKFDSLIRDHAARMRRWSGM